MAIVPPTIDGVLNWAADHIATWDAVVTAGGPGGANGLTPADITSLENALTNAQTDRAAANAARSTSLAATTTQNDSIAALRDLLSTSIGDIKAFAKGSTDPSAVYTAMEIPAPDPNPTKHYPVQPTGLVANPDSSGSVLLTWNGGTNVAGTVYEIQGSADGNAWSILKATKTKRITLNGFTPGQTFWFRVAASNNGQTSVPSNSVAVWGTGGSSVLSIAA
ncbi:MAG: fibronectin type III domain-containing protein [Fimbriimonadaceae bacterium]|nr:fibronectin type III domain-containing protein [Fimbriimonadaceae bacterium]